MEYKMNTVKDLALEDRPREKLLENGVKSMTNSELLAILLGSGTRDNNAIELSKQILKAYDNDLNKFIKVEIYELVRFKGVGIAKAVTVVAAIELGLRGMSLPAKNISTIKTSNDIFSIFHPLIGYSKYEEFWCLYLNRGLNVISKIKISQGGVHSTAVDPKKILKSGVDLLASSIVLCHNHPSGNPKPSNEDLELTNKLQKAGVMFDIQIIDHVIVTENSFFSFNDSGLMV